MKPIMNNTYQGEKYSVDCSMNMHLTLVSEKKNGKLDIIYIFSEKLHNATLMKQ